MNLREAISLKRARRASKNLITVEDAAPFDRTGLTDRKVIIVAYSLPKNLEEPQ